MKTLTIYKSSAGSGKTYTLVRAYVSLALKHPSNYKNILAVTFTNKATEEMRQRIISTLHALSENKTPQLAEDLAAELKKTSGEIADDAGKVLREMLHNYGKFSILTIDSFFNKTIRSLARELKLPLQFDMEVNQNYVRAVIVEQLLADIGINPFLTDTLEAFAINKIDDDKGWNIDKELLQISSELFKENFRSQKSTQKISDDFIRQLHELENDFEIKMKKIGETFNRLMKEHSLSPADFNRGNTGVANYFQKIRKPKNYESFKPSATVIGVHDSGNWASGSTTKKKLVQELAHSYFNKLLSEAITLLNSNFKSYCTARAILRLGYVASVIDLLDEQLKKYRDENELLLMSDVNHVIAQFIMQSDTPFIYEKTGNRYHHFLIDEFQDTSDFQWSNFLPLIENAMSMGLESLIVGDVKQSIYRWRGGNMNLLYKEIYNDLDNFSELLQTKNLNTNYRSKKNVVEFNNLLFGNTVEIVKPFINEKQTPLLLDTYAAGIVSQHVIEKNKEGGYVYAELLDAACFPDIDSSRYAKQYAWKAVALKKMIATINDLLKRGFDPGDIAILVRRNLDGNEIAQCLFENGFYKVITPDSLLLKGNIQITLLISALKYLSDRKDHVAKITVIHNYLRLNNMMQGYTDHAVFAANKEAHQDLLKKINLLQNRHLYDIAERLVQLFELNKKPDAFIQRFLDVIIDFCEKNPATIGGFLTWWNENSDSDKTSVIIPESTDAIHILTIHKSKGLEFPVVIMPFLDWDIYPKPTEIIWASTGEKPFSEVDRHPVNTTGILEESLFESEYKDELSQSLIDTINLMYVAFTRAEQQLYLFAPTCEMKKKDKISKAALLFNMLLYSRMEWEQWLNAKTPVLEIGLRENKRPVEAEPMLKLKSLRHFGITDWTEKIDVRVKTEFDDEHKAQFEKIETGKLIHEILSQIETEKDVQKAISKTLKNFPGQKISSSGLEDKISELLNLCADKKWFDGTYRIKNEAEIILPDATLKRPDRLMFKNKEVTIVDFKTGLKEKSYTKQVNEYARALAEMGYRVKGKYLLYVEINELSEVV